MKNKLISAIALSLSVVFMTAPAGAETSEERAEKKATALFENDARRGEEVNKLCFTSQIDGLSQTTERAAIVRQGVDEYLITTNQRCNALRRAQSVKVKSTSSCLRRGDLISGCFVGKIYEWNSDAEIADTQQDKLTEAG